MAALQAAIVTAFGEPREIKFISSESPVEDIETIGFSKQTDSGRDTKPASSSSLGLNPRNTFESFVVGPNNEIAHAASLAVAQAPARTYNPLFIYGGVGLGKTHLMQAIGQYVLAKKKNMKVIYLSSELFINEFIDAIQHNNLVKFRKRYRQGGGLPCEPLPLLCCTERCVW